MTRPMTRRGALGLMGTVAAAGAVNAAFGVPIVRTSPKSGLEPVILGSGAHRYECQHDWGTLPGDLALGNTHGVCEDAAGNIYVKHTVHASSTKADAVVVFDADGAFVRSWGAEYKGGAHGLHYSKEPAGEFLYLCDQARGIVDKTTLTGEKVWSISCPMESGLYNAAGEFRPTNIAVVPWTVGKAWQHRAGEFFIGDGYGKSWVHHYSAKGQYLRSWGGPGKERGQLNCPHGIRVDLRTPDEPRLVIADRANARLQYFTLDGIHQKFVTAELRMPCHFDARGGVLLVPDLKARVTLLDAQDALLTHLGDDTDFRLREKPRAEFLPGKFIAPHGACFDHAGNIYVVEWVEVGRVTRLRQV